MSMLVFRHTIISGRHFPQLKVSKAVEVICQYCYAFANHHRYLSNSALRSDSDGTDDNEGSDEEDNGIGIGLTSIDIDGDDGDEEGTDGSTLAQSPCHDDVRRNTSEAAWRQNDEERRELMLLEAAEHIKMARAQRALYQANVEIAIRDAAAKKDHLERVYTFVVDYGQIMELPSYRWEQPGCTYYFSPLSVFNLGVVNHAHVYHDGRVSEHMHAHVYHEGIGKKGANMLLLSS